MVFLPKYSGSFKNNNTSNLKSYLEEQNKHILQLQLIHFIVLK